MLLALEDRSRGVTGNSERASHNGTRNLGMYSSLEERRAKDPLVLGGFDRAFDWISKRVFPGKFEKQAGLEIAG